IPSGRRLSRFIPGHTKLLRHPDRRIQSVFMKPVEPVCATEVSTVSAADLLPTPLRSHRLQRIKRMEVRHFAQNPALVDRLGIVQRDAVILPRGQPLETVHVIYERGGAPSRAKMIVPRGPGSR